MHQQIFVNLPIKNMARTRGFFEALGYRFNPDFSNEQAACLVLGENLFAMLLVEDFFKSFIGQKPIANAHESIETLTCLSCASRQEVDTLVAKAVAAGGKVPRAPQDLGFMYSHGFEDLDGHTWELMHMGDIEQAKQG
ncbi:glyoxalase/bleomycin resistance/extradiol dioxygenase family protein [Roseateles sp. DAIF2]|uniref:VOC family protein n=1 Tax=Roseateles sp. DAIF2 TaxID=2714952 RepID=UPI0018A27242|nr:glyoxalase/bleomycin resistance/extradiol dioxygenase family protein [Roseateles sp. DAIF2]QPF71509.1 glyoxalase/bleomycin resistance/extradiol dioxygenase family protein [Roseateles sp. DAIF2]